MIVCCHSLHYKSVDYDMMYLKRKSCEGLKKGVKIDYGDRFKTDR